MASPAGTNRSALQLLFYRAVRDLKPVWMLEDMRTMEVFYLGEDAALRTYSPSEALLYAIVHDHQAYARHLLRRYADQALAKPAERFCCCPASAPHLGLAVRYDRRTILGLILQEAHRFPSAQPGSCFHKEDGRTPLHLACELGRPQAALMLLGSGASAQARDHDGCTPLDLLLDKLGQSEGPGGADERRCLDHLLVFMRKLHFKRREALRGEPERWSRLLGRETFGYLLGRAPPTLLLAAMQTVVRQLSPASFLDSMQELPIPSTLKPQGLPRGGAGGGVRGRSSQS